MEFHYSYSSSSFPGGLNPTEFSLTIPIFILVQVFFLLTLKKALQACEPENRKLPPDQVWLNLIPLFNLVWPFIMNPRVSASLRAEFAKRGLPPVGDFGHALGILYPALFFSILIPLLGLLGMIASLVMFILFWVKINQLKNQLQPNPTSPPPSLPPNPPVKN